MQRRIIFSASSLIFGLTLALGCKPATPEGTNPPGEDADATASSDGDSAEGSDAASNDDGDKKYKKDDAGPEDPIAIAIRTECPAEVGDSPVSVFNDNVLIRLPKGVEAFVEQNPMFATINPSKPESVSCVDGVAGAQITFGGMGYFSDDPEMTMNDFLKDTMASIGYPEGAKVNVESEKSKNGKRSIVASIEFTIEGEGEKRAYVTLKSAHDRMHWLAYECDVGTWNALKATFKSSAKSMLLLNPDGA